MDVREKGKRFERKVVKILNKHLSEDLQEEFHRVPASGGYHHLKSANMYGDIFTDYQEWPFIIECKHREAWNFNQLMSNSCKEFDNWCEQVKNDCQRFLEEHNQTKIPIIFFTRNQAPTYIAFEKDLPKEHYDNFLNKIINEENPKMDYKNWIITKVEN